jgi:hypothetical protein
LSSITSLRITTRIDRTSHNVRAVFPDGEPTP